MLSRLGSSFSVLVPSLFLVCCATPPGAVSADIESVTVQTESGDAQTQFLRALAYDEGRVVPLDRREAARWYRFAADRGHPAAQTNLGLLYYSGDGVEFSNVEAAKWFERAALQGFAAAQNNLGVMYLLGRGVAQDRVEARRLLSLAAGQGHAKAQSVLASIDAGDLDVDPDPRANAEAGSAAAQYRTSLMYLRGDGVERDELLAMRWLQRAADQCLPDAQFLLGWLHTEEGRFAEGAKWISLAAEQGHALAEAKLGRLYESGCGVPQDHSAAAQWMRRAADSGFSLAQYDMGLMYLKGLGVAASESDAFGWMKRAAEQGLPVAQEKVAFMYEHGRGVERDRIAAHLWYARASSQGAASATMDLERLERSLEPGELGAIAVLGALGTIAGSVR